LSVPNCNRHWICKHGLDIAVQSTVGEAHKMFDKSMAVSVRRQVNSGVFLRVWNRLCAGDQVQRKSVIKIQYESKQIILATINYFSEGVVVIFFVAGRDSWRKLAV
jgi:hypothetical protein